MSNEKILVRVLRNLADLISREARANPEFSAELDRILSVMPNQQQKKAKDHLVNEAKLPEIFSEWQRLGDIEFELWLRDLRPEVLRALVRRHDLDASKRSQKWEDREKLARLILDQLKLRAKRGSSFLKG